MVETFKKSFITKNKLHHKKPTQRNTHFSVHRSTIYGSKYGSNSSAHQQTTELRCVCVIMQSSKKLNTNICNNVDGPREYYSS